MAEEAPSPQPAPHEFSALPPAGSVAGDRPTDRRLAVMLGIILSLWGLSWVIRRRR